MAQIKSKKAKEYIEEHTSNITVSLLVNNGLHTDSSHEVETPLRSVSENKAICAVVIAETEAEERHAAELQKLRDKVLDIVCTDLSTNSLSYQQLEVLFTKKLNEK